uniref:Transmembrane protein n=1 Tax=Steinernema glaseri TaxID=37863 RepID=A0A1I7YKQ5_9BILA
MFLRLCLLAVMLFVAICMAFPEAPNVFMNSPLGMPNRPMTQDDLAKVNAQIQAFKTGRLLILFVFFLAVCFAYPPANYNFNGLREPPVRALDAPVRNGFVGYPGGYGR